MIDPFDPRLGAGRGLEPCGQAWAYRLVAMWCDQRAHDVGQQKLVKRCRKAYKGILAGPVGRFADLLETQTRENAAQWRALSEEMKAAAELEVKSP